MISVDSSLCKRNQLEKLSLISKRIESYDAIESNNDEVDKVRKNLFDFTVRFLKNTTLFAGLKRHQKFKMLSPII